MSTVEAVYVETCKICEAVSKWFQKVILEMQRGKQLSANRKIFEEYKRFYDSLITVYLFAFLI